MMTAVRGAIPRSARRAPWSHDPQIYLDVPYTPKFERMGSLKYPTMQSKNVFWTIRTYAYAFVRNVNIRICILDTWNAYECICMRADMLDKSDVGSMLFPIHTFQPSQLWKRNPIPTYLGQDFSVPFLHYHRFECHPPFSWKRRPTSLATVRRYWSLNRGVTIDNPIGKPCSLPNPGKLITGVCRACSILSGFSINWNKAQPYRPESVENGTASIETKRSFSRCTRRDYGVIFAYNLVYHRSKAGDVVHSRHSVIWSQTLLIVHISNDWGRQAGSIGTIILVKRYSPICIEYLFVP